MDELKNIFSAGTARNDKPLSGCNSISESSWCQQSRSIVSCSLPGNSLSFCNPVPVGHNGVKQQITGLLTAPRCKVNTLHDR